MKLFLRVGKHTLQLGYITLGLLGVVGDRTKVKLTLTPRCASRSRHLVSHHNERRTSLRGVVVEASSLRAMSAAAGVVAAIARVVAITAIVVARSRSGADRRRRRRRSVAAGGRRRARSRPRAVRGLRRIRRHRGGGRGSRERRSRSVSAERTSRCRGKARAGLCVLSTAARGAEGDDVEAKCPARGSSEVDRRRGRFETTRCFFKPRRHREPPVKSNPFGRSPQLKTRIAGDRWPGFRFSTTNPRRRARAASFPARQVPRHAIARAHALLARLRIATLAPART